MKSYHFDCFISKNTKYVLIDYDGDVRATSPSITGIAIANYEKGWGDVYECNFDGKILKIGKKVE